MRCGFGPIKMAWQLSSIGPDLRKEGADLPEMDGVEITGMAESSILGQMGLKPGDVIQLDQNADETLTALVEGVAKIKGYAGVQRGFQAFKVMKKLSLEEGRSYG